MCELHRALLCLSNSGQIIEVGSAGRDLVNISRSSIDRVDPGMSVLMAAVATQKYDVAKFLLHRGADVNYTAPARGFSLAPRDAEGWAAFYAEESTFNQPRDADLLFYRFIKNVRRASGWKPFVRAPRVSLAVLRRLCEKERARPPPELDRLFALDKFIFWRVLSFWRSDRDLHPHITTRDTTAPPY